MRNSLPSELFELIDSLHQQLAQAIEQEDLEVVWSTQSKLEGVKMGALAMGACPKTLAKAFFVSAHANDVNQ